MGACQSRHILPRLEEIIFSLGSVYSFIASHLSAIINRFYALLLSSIVHVDDVNVPSKVCDQRSGVCLRPKDRLRQRKKTELRMRRAELAARGLDPNLALKRLDSRHSTKSNAPGEKFIKRWSRADSFPADLGKGVISSSDRPLLEDKATDRIWVMENVVLRSTAAQGKSAALLSHPCRTTTPASEPMVGSRYATAGPFKTVSTRDPATNRPKSAQIIKRRQSPPPAEPRKQTQDKDFGPKDFAGSRCAKGDQRPFLQEEPIGITVRREGGTGERSIPAVDRPLRDQVARYSLDVRPNTPVETLSRARQSLDAHLRDCGFLRTQTMPANLAGIAVRSDRLSGVSADLSPGNSVSDMVSAACKTGAYKRGRKMWRDELDKVARGRVRAVAGSPS